MPERKPISKAILRRKVQVKSELAIRLLTRGVWNTAGALYRIDAVWRMIGRDEEIDKMESLVAFYLNQATEEMKMEKERLELLMQQHGIDELPDYTQKREITVRVLSPFIAIYLSLVLKADEIIQRLDALWLFGVVPSVERKRRLLFWILELRKLRLKIRKVERRTRELALSRGQKESLEVEDANLIEESEPETA